MTRCIYCRGENVVRNGKRKRKVKTKQSYLCTNCGRQFVEADGFERMRHKPKIIARAIHMHNDGLSLSKVQNHLWQYDGVKVSRWAIAKWVRKYSILFKRSSATSEPHHKRAYPLRREIHEGKKGG